MLDSSFLTVDAQEIDVFPLVSAAANRGNFLVYYFDLESFGREARGTLKIELEATDLVRNGTIEVDPDVDDPLIPNEDEFDIDEPQFRAEAEASIEVVL